MSVEPQKYPPQQIADIATIEFPVTELSVVGGGDWIELPSGAFLNLANLAHFTLQPDGRGAMATIAGLVVWVEPNGVDVVRDALRERTATS